MERMIYRPHVRHMELPDIRLVSLARPFLWLRQGLSDLLQSWPISLAFGVVFAVLGYLLINFAWSRLHLAMAFTSGFLLMAPFLALLFYDLSRQIDGGSPLSLRHALTAWRENAWSIGLYAALLLLLLIAWERMTAILIALLLVENVPTLENLVSVLLTSGGYMSFVLAYGLFGMFFAAVVFALSVVSLPMMLDRKVDIATALVTSLWTVRQNPMVMLLWAAIIVVLTGVGYWTSFIGLALFFPLLGHATWRAYRDLIEPAA